MTTPLLIHLAATWFMTGLIWVIQLVHYPLFIQVGYLTAEQYRAYQHSHMTRISFIVGPVMVIELITAGWLILTPAAALPAAWAWTNLALLLAIWLSTATLQGPCHRRLNDGFQRQLVHRLVRTNWLRTTLWTARAVLLLILLVQAPET